MLRAGELALLGDADFGRQRFFAGRGVGRAVEQAAQVADGGLQFIDRAGFFEGFAAAEVGGFLAFAAVGCFAGEEVLAGGVDVVGAAFGGGHFWQWGEGWPLLCLLKSFLESCIREVVVVEQFDCECCRELDFFGAETLENVGLEEMEGSPRQIRADLARFGQAGTSLPRART